MKQLFYHTFRSIVSASYLWCSPILRKVRNRFMSRPCLYRWSLPGLEPFPELSELYLELGTGYETNSHTEVFLLIIHPFASYLCFETNRINIEIIGSIDYQGQWIDFSCRWNALLGGAPFVECMKGKLVYDCEGDGPGLVWYAPDGAVCRFDIHSGQLRDYRTKSGYWIRKCGHFLSVERDSVGRVTLLTNVSGEKICVESRTDYGFILCFYHQDSRVPYWKKVVDNPPQWE